MASTETALQHSSTPSPYRRTRRWLLASLVAFWAGVGLYWLALSTSLVGYNATRYLASLAVGVLLPAACITMFAAGIKLIVGGDPRRGSLLVPSIASVLLFGLWFVFQPSMAFPLQRSGMQFEYGIIKAFYDTTTLGSPRVVVIPVSPLGPQTLLALLPLVALYRRVRLPGPPQP